MIGIPGRTAYTVSRTVDKSEVNYSPITLIQIVPATNHRITILGIDIGFQGSTPATTPALLTWQVQSGAQTVSGSPLSAVKLDRGYAETITGTYNIFDGATTAVEPTKIDLITFGLHQQGSTSWRPPPGEPLIVASDERVGLEYTGLTDPGANFDIQFTVYLEQ